MKRLLPTVILFSVMCLFFSHPAAPQAGSSSLDQDLILAAARGDTAAVQQLLQRGANIEGKGIFSRGALIQAVEFDKPEVVKLLLDKGANIEATDQVGETALLHAAAPGNTEILTLLLDKGAKIDQEGWAGYTALLLAAHDGKIEIAKLLLEKGANIEAKRAGDTALQTAAREDKAEVVKLLLDKGANTEVKDRDGNTPLIKAAYSGNAEIVKVLLEKGANIQAKGEGNWTALSSAEKRNQATVVQLLQQALSKDPQASFAESVSAFQRHPLDGGWGRQEEVSPDEVIKAALRLPSPPAVPEEARQLFVQASALIKGVQTRDELAQPIGQLRKALWIAPWWGNAYYNLARAYELSEQYDDAVKQLNYYLETNPQEADANEARARISAIQVEKQTALRRQQDKEGVLAVKYVSGGATRLRFEDVPAFWRPKEFGGLNTLYTYGLAEEGPFYANAFRMSNGRIIAITLVVQVTSGAYAGDKIGVWDLTDAACIQGGVFSFGVPDHTDPCGAHYGVSVTNPPNATVTVTDLTTRSSVTLLVALLYRGRALKAYWDGHAYQVGADNKVWVLDFDMSMVKAAGDPNVNAMGLTPSGLHPVPGK